MSEKRAVHMKGIRNQILRTAEKLFLTQGYKNNNDSSDSAGIRHYIRQHLQHF